MGIADSIKNMADRAVEKIGADRAKQGVEAAGDKADKVTGGRLADQIDKGLDRARGEIDERDRGSS